MWEARRDVVSVELEPGRCGTLGRSDVAVVPTAEMGSDHHRCLSDIAGGIWRFLTACGGVFKCASDALLLDSMDSMETMDYLSS